MREQLKQLLSQIGTATADMLGVRNIFGTLASALVSFSGARLMEDTLDGKTSFTKGGALTLGKTVTDMVLKSDFFVGMPKDAGQIASAVGTVISLDGVMDKLAVEAPPAVEAIGRLEVLGRRLLTGDVAPRVAATRSQLWLLQRTVEPLVEAIASSAVDADHWQNIIGDLRSVYGPALFAETA